MLKECERVREAKKVVEDESKQSESTVLIAMGTPFNPFWSSLQVGPFFLFCQSCSRRTDP